MRVTGTDINFHTITSIFFLLFFTLFPLPFSLFSIPQKHILSIVPAGRNSHQRLSGLDPSDVHLALRQKSLCETRRPSCM